MKKYEVLALYVITIVKVVAKCSIIITNPNCGKHTPNKYYRKHMSVLDEVIRERKQKKKQKKRKKKGTASSSTESRNESLISKTARPTNARKKVLMLKILIRASIASTTG